MCIYIWIELDKDILFYYPCLKFKIWVWEPTKTLGHHAGHFAGS